MIYPLAMHTDLRKLESEMLQSISGLNSTQTQATPSARPEAWNVQEIVEHLVLTYRSTVTEFEARIAKGRPVKTKASLRARIAQFMVIKLGRFPHGFEAPKAVAPSRLAVARSGDELARYFSAEVTRLDEASDAAEKMFGSQRSVNHFRLGPLSIAQWRRFHLIHAHHHVRQIDAIRRDHGFGSARSSGV